MIYIIVFCLGIIIGYALWGTRAKEMEKNSQKWQKYHADAHRQNIDLLNRIQTLRKRIEEPWLFNDGDELF